MGKNTEEKIGKIEDIIFRNNQNGYTVAVFQTEDEEFTIVGNMHEATKGSEYILRGRFVMHKSYGEQFSFFEYEQKMPEGTKAIEEFLSSGIIRGVGRKTAALIVDMFGEDTFNMLENEPEKLTMVSGIGKKKAAVILESYSLHREFAKVSLYLQEFGLNTLQVMKIYKFYGSRTIKVLEDNPYQLIDDIYGIGFRKADEIAVKLGKAGNDPRRIEGGLKYMLMWYANEGHTFCPQQELCESCGQLLDVSISDIEEVLIDLAFAGDVAIENADGRKQVYLMSYYRAEMNVTRCLAGLNMASLKPVKIDPDSMIKAKENETGIYLSDRQKSAVKSCVDNGISVITGGPGTGKTTIINTIIGLFEESGLEVSIAAPTGRAAKRITETSGHEASTIHRLLEYHYAEDDDVMIFGRDAENTLECDVLIIDEASMIDILLMNALVSAIRPGTRFVIVGDADQLPSVGAGNVLRDIIDSEYIYSIRLTDIFRQAARSLIVVNAHRINSGEYPEYNEKGGEFFFMRKKTEKEMLDLITELCIKRLPAFYTELDPLKDIQVLTPVRKGTLGTFNLNRELQQAINPLNAGKKEMKFGDRTFREGDKVMQIRNNYQMQWKRAETFEEGEGVFNGDVGFIETIDREYARVIVVFDEDRYASYDFADMDQLDLAYAVTVHKAQGSEFPVMIMPVSWFPPILATRNLLYTAVTRGKEAVIMVGSEDKMCAMVDNNRITARYSGLKRKLAAFNELEIL